MKTKVILLFVLILSIYCCGKAESDAVKSFKEWVKIEKGVWEKYLELKAENENDIYKTKEAMVTWLKSQSWIAHTYSDIDSIYYQDYQNRQAVIITDDYYDSEETNNLEDNGTEEEKGGTKEGKLESEGDGEKEDEEKNEGILILNTFSPSDEVGQKVLTEATKVVNDLKSTYGWDNTIRGSETEKLTLENFNEGVKNYSIIIILGHGGFAEGLYNPETKFKAKEFYTSYITSGTEDYDFDLTNLPTNLIGNKYYEWTQGYLLARHNSALKVYLLPGFFSKKFPNMKGKMVFMVSCHSGRKSFPNSNSLLAQSMAQAFLGKGATFFGTTDYTIGQNLIKDNIKPFIINMCTFNSNNEAKSDLTAMIETGAQNDFNSSGKNPSSSLIDEKYYTFNLLSWKWELDMKFWKDDNKSLNLYEQYIGLYGWERNEDIDTRMALSYTYYMVRYANDEIYINSDFTVTIKNIPKDTNGLKIYIYKADTEDLDKNVPTNPFIITDNISGPEKKVMIKKVPIGKKIIKVEASCGGGKTIKAQKTYIVKCKADDNEYVIAFGMDTCDVPPGAYYLSGAPSEEEVWTSVYVDRYMYVTLNDVMITYPKYHLKKEQAGFSAKAGDILYIKATQTFDASHIQLSPIYIRYVPDGTPMSNEGMKLLTEGMPSTDIPKILEGSVVFFEGFYSIENPPELFKTIQENKYNPEESQ